MDKVNQKQDRDGRRRRSCCGAAFLYACNRAEFFAQGAVDILQNLAFLISLFGSEVEILELLEALAEDMVRHRKPWRKTGCIS